MDKVETRGEYYYVMLENDVRIHKVGKNKACCCGNTACLAIEAVREYLKAGGERAVDPPTCPICGDAIIPDHELDGRYTREPGWRCKSGGKHHFYQAKTAKIKAGFAKNPWLFPPAPGYPGVLREEVLTAEQCAEASRIEFLKTGYDPTAKREKIKESQRPGSIFERRCCP